MSTDKKSAEEKPKEVSQKSKDASPQKEETSESPPLSVWSSVLFLVRLSLLSLLVIGVLILLLGIKHVSGGPSSSSSFSPSSLPPLVASHMEGGAFVPVHDGTQSLNLFVSVVGAVSGAEETLLLLHRVPGSSLSFSEVQKQLAQEGLASIAIDLPGFGLSDKPERASFSLDYLAQATVDALTSLHIDKVHIVAVGESCFVAARLVERFPHVMSSIAMIDCVVPPTRAPSFPVFAFEHSPALPSFVHTLLFGGPPRDESASVAAANRWLTVFKNGQVSYFSFCTSVGGGRLLSEDPLKGLCDHNNCALGGMAVDGVFPLDESLSLGKRVAKFVNQLPEEAKQKKAARPPPKVQYVQPSAGDKYGSHDHGGHAHGDHGGHVHGAGCNH